MESRTWTEVTDAEALVQLLGTPTARVRDKGRPALLDVDRAWLAASPFCVVATSDADGRCDASPKGDPAGWLVQPVLAVVVDIEDVYFHCAKAFLRSGLWQPETWDPTGAVPRRAVVAARAEPDGRSVEELDAYYGPSYAEGLYG